MHSSTIVLGEPPAGAAIPTADYGVPAYELLDAELPGADVVEDGELERLRILAGTPAWGRELDDRVLPAEAGLEERAISFTKGCYPGQEPVRAAPLPRPSEPRPAGSRAGGHRDPRLRRRADARRQGRGAGHELRRGRRPRARARVRPSRGPRRGRPPPGLPDGEAATLFLPAPVAQGIERCPAEAEVARSNRAGRTTWGNPWFPHEPPPSSRGTVNRNCLPAGKAGLRRRAEVQSTGERACSHSRRGEPQGVEEPVAPTSPSFLVGHGSIATASGDGLRPG